MKPYLIVAGIALALLLALVALAPAQDLVIDQTGTLTADQVALLSDAQRSLREQSGITIAPAFFPQVTKDEAPISYTPTRESGEWPTPHHGDTGNGWGGGEGRLNTETRRPQRAQRTARTAGTANVSPRRHGVPRTTA